VRSSIRARTRFSIPPALAAQLELEEVEKRGVTLADGRKHWVPYVGPVQLSFGKRHYPHALRAGLTGIAKTRSP
jgi:hypothetical protein